MLGPKSGSRLGSLKLRFKTVFPQIGMNLQHCARCSNVIEKVFLSRVHTVCSTHFTFIFSIVDHDHTNLKTYQKLGRREANTLLPILAL